jgi:hypothetical protein
MWFIDHPECNMNMGAPPGNEAHVATLRVKRDIEELGGRNVVSYTSYWKPNEEDLKLLAAGGVVALTVYGLHPVLKMEVQKHE